MAKVTKVYMHESGRAKKVYFTDDNKPKVNDLIKSKWQVIIDKIARLMTVKASLINRLDQDHIEIFMMSQNASNPYTQGSCDTLGQGAYCEMVMGSKKALNVQSAVKHPLWKDSVYVDINLISYYGLPIIWPDGEVFGTLCVIDDKENEFNQDFQDIFLEFKLSIEKDLEILMKSHELTMLAEFDGLTGVYNRRKVDQILEQEFLRSKRANNVFSLALIDLDKFKIINDVYGHQMGDTILKAFSRHVDNRIRKTDFLGRMGGDEFILICPETDLSGTQNLIKSFETAVLREMNILIEDFGFSYGIAQYNPEDDIKSILRRADDRLYEMKKASID